MPTKDLPNQQAKKPHPQKEDLGIVANFENLFNPIKIGNVELKNRLLMLPMTTGFSEADNTVGERLIDFYAERAKGGVSLIIVPFDPIDMGSPLNPGLYHDRFIPDARKLTDAVHAHEAKIATQLLAMYHWITKEGAPAELVAPSPVFNKIVGATPRILTIEEIHRLAEKHGEAARRAREANFDAVELPMIGGYLLNRFLSPHSNKRHDEYGGSLGNRMRLPLEIIKSIKQKAGRDFAIICRLNVQENIEEGHTIEYSAKEVAPAFEAASIQAINVYTGWHESPVPTVAMSVPRGYFVYLAEKIKEGVNIPVITANRINDPILADKIISEGKADLVGMGRALLADPELPNKAREGKIEEIRPCIACGRCLDEVLSVYKSWGKQASTICTVNPMIGKEREYTIKPTTRARKVLVVGGGPGGMEAARVAALRGHKVTLYEKEDKLGGCLIAASIAPYKDEIANLTEYLITQVYKSGVEVRLNIDIGIKDIEEEKPEVVVLATGATPIIPNILGAKGSNVVTAIDALTGSKKVGDEVIIVGGGMIGCETAEFLAQKGKNITILEMLSRIASDLGITCRPFIMARLREAGIRMETNLKAEEITSEGVKGSRDGVSEFFAGDTVVLAVGFRANNRLAHKLEGKVASLYSVGDCVQPRKILHAIKEGFCVGMEI